MSLLGKLDFRSEREEECTLVDANNLLNMNKVNMFCVDGLYVSSPCKATDCHG